MRKANALRRLQFRYYAKPLFRTCEIACNHAARILEKSGSLENFSAQLEEINAKRMQCQRILNKIGNSHGYVCAECKGKCCGGVRERDAFTDRVLQDPQTSYRQARRKSGKMAAYKHMTKADGEICFAANGNPVPGHCTELTDQGCRIPYELRPIQCTAYFCKPTVEALSESECKIGIKALAGLMNAQVGTVMLALKTRVGAGRE